MAKHGVFAQNRVTIDQKLDKKDKQVAELKRTPPPPPVENFYNKVFDGIIK